jgi:hypothetical protein
MKDITDYGVAEAREQFGNPEEGEHPPLEADTRGLLRVNA